MNLIRISIDRPIAVGTLIGEVSRDELITPRGAMPGDRLLLTKFIPIEAVAILAQEFHSELHGVLSEAELRQGANYHRQPGISVLPDAQIALAVLPVPCSLKQNDFLFSVKKLAVIFWCS